MRNPFKYNDEPASGVFAFSRQRSGVWKNAFRYAVKVLVFSAIWLLLGMVFIFGGMLLFSITPRAGPGALVGAMILFGIGYVIVYMGILVAIFRYLPEAIAEKLK